MKKENLKRPNMEGLPKPVVKYIKNLEKMAVTDPLTGLKNRRGFDSDLEREIQVLKRNNYDKEKEDNLVVACCDINGLKEINDSYGHSKGDEILKLFAKYITPNGRESHLNRPLDVGGRIGGDEFGIILPYTNLETVMESVFVPIREDFCESSMRLIESDYPNIGLSMGVTSYPDITENSLEILKDADDAMYKSKYRKNEENEKGKMSGHISLVTYNEYGEREIIDWKDFTKNQHE